MCAIFVLSGDKPVEMVERRYDKEEDLQRLLEANPALLSAEAPEDERRQWLLVKREIGVPGREGGSDRWSLDHLFVDQDAIPTFVEVKRSTNREIRRMVIGQMLDYAANASTYWDAGALRASFEERFSDPDGASEELAEFLEGELDPESFWEEVAGNLQDRNLRLIFVADRIPRELRAIVEFLNEQLERTEVTAVEVKQYVAADDDRINIVPQIIGETEMARRVKRTATKARTRRPRATERQFQDEIREAYEPELAERVLTLFEHLKARATRYKFGRGQAASAIVWVGEHDDPQIANPVAIRIGTKHISVMMKHLPKDRGPDEMARLVKLLRDLPGTSDALNDAVAKNYRTYCDFDTSSLLVSDQDLKELERVLDEAAVRDSAAG